MALKKLIQEQASYDFSFFTAALAHSIGGDGPLEGFKVEEKVVDDKVYLILHPGAFVRSGSIYILPDKVDGETDEDHSLEITQFANQPNFTYELDLEYSGVPTLFLVETATDPDNPDILPVFQVKLSPGETDIVISMRKIDPIARYDDDPLIMLANYYDDVSTEVAVPAPFQWQVFAENDPAACYFPIVAETDDPDYLIEAP
jgi:hypothetical protein